MSFKIYKKFISIIFFFLITFFQYSCRKNNDLNKITIASSGKIESIDPARANTLKSLQLISSLGDTLYELNENGRLIPKLALEMPSISNDKLKIVIKLRENIIFHDGTPFNSKAMKFTIERFQNIGTTNYILGNKIKSIETPKKDILVINLLRPSSSIKGLLTSLNLTAISPTFYRNHFNKFLNDQFVGTGNYTLKSFTNEIQILEPFHNSWDKKPKNNGINFVGYSNSSSLYGAMRSRQIDVLLSNSIDDVQRNHLTLLSQKNLIREGTSKPIEISFITIRTNSEPFNNKEIRLALAKSLNRDLISKKVSYGLREPTNSIVPQIFKRDKSVSWPKYNPKEAIKILRKNGYCKGKKLILPLTYRSNVPTDKLIALYWMQDVDKEMSDCLSINITGVESTTIYKNLSNGLYSAVILDWTGAYSDPDAYLSPLLSCKTITGSYCQEGESVYSGSFWGSNKVQTLLFESENLNDKERLNKLIEIEKIAAESIPYIPIWISSQKAWCQTFLSTPIFDGSGRIIMSELEYIDE